MEQQPLFNLEPFIDDVPDEQPQNVLSAYLGEEAAAQIIDKIGGLSLRVPVETSGLDYEYLVGIIGSELTEKLSHFFGGEHLYIPKNRFAKTDEKRRAIRNRVRALKAQGNTNARAIQTTALEFKLSDRYIRRVLKS